jgi:putative Mg2+ transporter-C (MgtC) family protein
MGNGVELLTRLVVGTVLGAIIGYERRLHGRPAGLRTHLLVALASTTFMLVSTQFVYFQHYGKNDLVTIDTSRIAASVVTGVGFLGGGAILRIGANVQGLTTAAGLWLVAAIGLSAGGGMYGISAAATAIGVAALTVMRRLERKDDDVVRRKIALTLDEAAPPLKTIFSAQPSMRRTSTNTGSMWRFRLAFPREQAKTSSSPLKRSRACGIYEWTSLNRLPFQTQIGTTHYAHDDAPLHAADQWVSKKVEIVTSAE